MAPATLSELLFQGEGGARRVQDQPGRQPEDHRDGGGDRDARRGNDPDRREGRPNGAWRPLIPRQGVDRYEKATGPTLAFVEKDGFIAYDSAFDAVLGPGSRPFPLVPLTLTLVGLVLFALLVARRRYRRAKR